MASIFKFIDVWWGLHPHLTELLFLCVNALLALFPERSRRWVLKPLFYSGLGMMRLMQREAKNDLEIMRAVDGDAYKLVAYIAYFWSHALVWTSIMTAIFWLGINVLSHWRTGHPTTIRFEVLFIGGIIGRAVKFEALVAGMFHPEAAIKRLESVIAGKPLE